MSEATEKQTAILLKNGFTQDQINQWNKAKISEEIGKILGNKGNFNKAPSVGQIGATTGISEVNHSFESEYEFGPAGNRHKIKYRTIDELKTKYKELEEAGFLFESVKM